MAGPQGALFEPDFISVSKDTDCSDLLFHLKGFKLSVAVRMRASGERLINGPQGITLKLEDHVASTDQYGQASFPEVQVT